MSKQFTIPKRAVLQHMLFEAYPNERVYQTLVVAKLLPLSGECLTVETLLDYAVRYIFGTYTAFSETYQRVRMSDLYLLILLLVPDDLFREAFQLGDGPRLLEYEERNKADVLEDQESICCGADIRFFERRGTSLFGQNKTYACARCGLSHIRRCGVVGVRRWTKVRTQHRFQIAEPPRLKHGVGKVIRWRRQFHERQRT